MLVRMNNQFDLTRGLLSTLFLLLTLWYLSYLWGRRKWYIYSWKVPGPLAFPIFGNIHLFLGGIYTLPKVIRSLADKFPDIIRIWMGPNLMYLILKPEHAERILCNCLGKDDLVYKTVADEFTGYGLIFLPVTEWKKHRKLIMPAFGRNILNSFMGTFDDKARILSDQLQQHIGKIDFNLQEVLFRFAVDTVCETLMKVDMDSQTSDSATGEHLNSILQMLTHRLGSVWYHFDFVWKFSPMRKELRKVVKRFMEDSFMHNVHEKIITYSEQSATRDEIMEDDNMQRLAFLDLLIQTTDLTKNELIQEVKSFTVAGPDSLATALCCTMVTLGIFQDVQENVYQEIMELCGPDRRIDFTDIPKLKYTERVLKETLRIFPPAPFMLRHIDRDVNLGEYTIPEGASTLFHITSIHMNEKYWRDPYQFDPDRFLPQNAAERPQCSYLPFSYGPRNCIGGRYAMTSILTTLAILVRRFRIFSEYKSLQEIEVLATISIKLKDGAKVRLELR